MIIRGESDQAETLEHLSKAKNDSECKELELRSIDFDYELASAFIELLRSKEWQTIRLTFCRGLVNDIVTAVSNSHISSFHFQSAVNANTMNALAFGLNYSKVLSGLHLSVEMNSNECTSLAKAIARNVDLQELDLSGSSMDTYMLSHMGFALRINRTIRSLCLDGCYIEDAQLASLLFALQDHPNLKSISLQHNSCHEQSMSAISALLQYNDLEELDMSYLIRKKRTSKPVVKNEEEEKAEELENEILDETSQQEQEEDEKKEQDKSSNEDQIKSEEKKSVEAQVKQKDEEPETVSEEDDNRVKNKSLRALKLAGNGLNDGFVESMLDIFCENSVLEELNLFGNCMTDRGVHCIIRKLPDLKKLKSLWLGHNRFTPVAQKRLLDTMRTNYVLEELNLRSMDSDPELDMIQQEIDYFARLNRAGRIIFSSDVSQLPMSVWPLILERANRIYSDEGSSNTLYNHSHAADAIFCLLHGPALLDNPNIAHSDQS